MQEEYRNFYKSNFTPQRYKAYQEEFAKVTGKLYTLSTSPCFLKSNVAEQIKDVVLPTFVKLLNSKEYKDEIYSRGWFLPKSPVEKRDFFGSLDFHINGNEARLIELNFFIPGHIGFVELFPQLFSKSFDYKFDVFTDGFEKKLAQFLETRFEGNKIALAVNHMGLSVHYFDHYKYIEKFLNKNGINAKVVYAKDAKVSSSNKPMWDEEEYDGVFNIVIPRIWEHNAEEFKDYTDLFETRPESFFPNPWCWTMGDKRFLTLLSNINVGDYGLSEDDVEILRSVTLKTRLMNRFSNVKELCDYFGGEKNLVIKPIDNFHTQGVYIQPTIEKIQEIFDTKLDTYVVQELFNAEDVYYEDENAQSIVPYKTQLRTEFFNGEFSNFRAYGYSDPFGLSPMMPVVLVK